MKALEKWNHGTSNTVFQQYFSSLLEGMCCILTDMLLWLLRSPISDRPGDCWGDGRGGGGGYCILTDTLLFAEVTRSCPAWQSLEGVAVVAGEGGYWRIAVVEGKGVGGVTAYWPTDALLWLKGRGWGGLLHTKQLTHCCGCRGGGWGGLLHINQLMHCCGCGEVGVGGLLHTNQLTHCCGCGEVGGGGGCTAY